MALQNPDYSDASTQRQKFDIVVADEATCGAMASLAFFVNLRNMNNAFDHDKQMRPPAIAGRGLGQEKVNQLNTRTIATEHI
jgi:hypothetical protein